MGKRDTFRNAINRLIGSLTRLLIKMINFLLCRKLIIHLIFVEGFPATQKKILWWDDPYENHILLFQTF